MAVLQESQTRHNFGIGESPSEKINVGGAERAASIASGAIIALVGLQRASLPGLLVAGLGGALINRGVSGHCPMYKAMHVNTADDAEGREERIRNKGIHVEQAYLINRTPEDLYTYWRNFENLPRIMTHLESVKALDEKRSHWVAKAPWIVGGTIAWDAEITSDEPGERIAWRSLPGSSVDSVGEIRFSGALGDRGTEVHVYMEYLPPAGLLGHWLATALGQAPRRQMREDIRNFKRLMELGELPTTEGQPHGTCSGQDSK